MANNLLGKSTDDTPKQSLTFSPMFIANVDGCFTRQNIDIRLPWPRSIIIHNGNSKYRPYKGEPKFGPVPITDTVDLRDTNSITGNSNDGLSVWLPG